VVRAGLARYFKLYNTMPVGELERRARFAAV
jgi:hypothetical protein